MRNCKKVVSLIFIILMLMTCINMPIFAATYYTDGNYTYYIKNTITMDVAIHKVSENLSGHVDIPSWLGGYYVAEIGKEAFKGNKNITSVSIPFGVSTIGLYAFQDCTGLKSVTFNKSSLTEIKSYAFSGCSSLESIALPAGVKTLGSNVFANCTNLKTASIPITVSTNEYNIFYNCTSLTDFSFSTGSYSDGAKDITKIPGYMFQKCTSLETITIPYSVNTIDCYAFLNSGIKRIVIPDTVTTIANDVFEGCSKLTDVTIGKGITSIPDGMFYKATALKSIVIPNNVTQISDDAFRGCSSLENIDLPDNLKTIGTSAFSDCTALKNVELGRTVETISGFAFSGCTALESISLCKGLKTIGSYAFSNCNNLATVVYTGTMADWKLVSGYKNVGNAAVLCEKALVERGIFNNNTHYWEYYDNGLLIIDGTGNMPAWSSAVGAPWSKYKDSIIRVEIADGVTNVGAYAFYKYPAINNVSLAESVESIGEYAFSNCAMLKGITLPGSLKTIDRYAFNLCNYLTEIIIPDSVISIGEYCFNSCTAAKRIVIGNGIKNISDYAFRYCTNAEEIIIGAEVTTISQRAFLDCMSVKTIKIPSKVKSIGVYAFANCRDLVEVELLEGLESIGANAFNDCKSLTTIYIPKSVKELGAYAFYNCSNLESIIIPESTKTIGESAFLGCSALTEVTIPENTTAIPDYAFQKCTNLKVVNMHEDITSIGNGAFVSCANLKEISLPEKLTTIGENAFSSSGLTSIDIPDSVNSIGEGAFFETPITELSIPEGITDIYSDFLYGCTKLTKVYLPSTIASIGRNAIYGCIALSDIYYSGTEDEWEKVTIDSTNADWLKNVTVHFKEYVYSVDEVVGLRSESATITGDTINLVAGEEAATTGVALVANVDSFSQYVIDSGENLTRAESGGYVYFIAKREKGLNQNFKIKVVDNDGVEHIYNLVVTFKGEPVKAKTVTFKVTPGNATVTLEGETKTAAGGVVTFENVAYGTRAYTVFAEEYATKEGTLEVAAEKVTKTVTLVLAESYITPSLAGIRAESVTYDEETHTISVTVDSIQESGGVTITIPGAATKEIKLTNNSTGIYRGAGSVAGSVQIVASLSRSTEHKATITYGECEYPLVIKFLWEAKVKFNDIVTLRTERQKYTYNELTRTITLYYDRFNILQKSGTSGFAFIVDDSIDVIYEFDADKSTNNQTDFAGTTPTAKYTSMKTGKDGEYGDVDLMFFRNFDSKNTSITYPDSYARVTLVNKVTGESTTYIVNHKVRDVSVEGDVDITAIHGLRVVEDSFVVDNENKTITFSAKKENKTAGFAVEVGNGLTIKTRPRKVLSPEANYGLAIGNVNQTTNPTLANACDRYVNARQSWAKNNTQTYKVKVFGGEKGLTYSIFTVTINWVD